MRVQAAAAKLRGIKENGVLKTKLSQVETARTKAKQTVAHFHGEINPILGAQQAESLFCITGQVNTIYTARGKPPSHFQQTSIFLQKSITVETKEQRNALEHDSCLGRLELEKIVVFWKCDRVFPL
jgi:hypothetical protein